MISVIMSVYNAEKYLSQAIESVLAQSFKNFEFIIINDCSNDKSSSIIEEYKRRDKRIKLISNKVNKGLTKNLNKGIAISQNEFVARMDADDVALPNRFQCQINFFRANSEVDVLGSYCHDIDEEGNIIRDRIVPVSNEDIVRSIHITNPVCHPTVMFRKDKLKSLGFYNENFRVVQDYDLWMRCVANNIRIYNLPEFLLKYRVDDSYFSRKSLSYRLTDFKIRRRGYKLLKLAWRKQIYLCVPLILGIIPNRLYRLLKKWTAKRKYIK